MTTALVLGASGFIGRHLVAHLVALGVRVRAVDIVESDLSADEFVLADLRDTLQCRRVFDGEFDEVYQLAADMGGAEYVFSGRHDFEILTNSSQINLNIIRCAGGARVGRLFFASSACIYPEHLQQDVYEPKCAETDAYPADPDSEYGWEKLFAERLYLTALREGRLDVRIARLHNVFGPECAWRGGREKAPAALARKVAEAPPGGTIEVWGDGQQTRSFLHIGECLEGMARLMSSDFPGPVNLGSSEMVSIAGLTRLIMTIAGKEDLTVRFVPGPRGVPGRTSDNRLILRRLGWAPSRPLREGLEETYWWVEREVRKRARKGLQEADA